MARLLLVAAAMLLGLTACNDPRAEVSVAPGAALGNHEMVYFTFANSWTGNHSVVRVLQQEMERRRMSVKTALPEDGVVSESALVLQMDFAGDKKAEGMGRIDFLSFLDFRLNDSTGKELARVHYSGEDLDRLEQKELIHDVAERLFGPR